MAVSFGAQVIRGRDTYNAVEQNEQLYKEPATRYAKESQPSLSLQCVIVCDFTSNDGINDLRDKRYIIMQLSEH